MLFFGLIALALILAIIGIIIGIAFLASESPDFPDSRKAGWAILAVTAVLFFGVTSCSTITMSTHDVPEGHVGIVYAFGSIEGQTGDGLVWTKPWEDVKSANIQVQTHRFENLSAASRETQDVAFTVTLNYQVSPDAIQDLYRRVGPDYFAKLVEARINQYFKDETVQYLAIEVTTKRDELRDAVAERLQADLSTYSINVVALLIDNINYSDAFNQSIEQKQVATQDALREQERVKQKEFEAQQAEAVALGEANSLRIRAEGQAAANALLTASITPALIQWEAVQRLSDNIQIALIPSGNGIIIDPATILAGTQP